MTITTANRLELLKIAENVAQEKMIEPELILEAMEESYARAAKSKYGNDLDIRAQIDRQTGDLKMVRVREVVEEVEEGEGSTQVTLHEAKAHLEKPEIGDMIVDPLPPMEFGRIATQAAKQVILQKVREAERERQYEEFKDREGEIINGIVRRVEYGNVTVDVGHGEAICRRDQLINREIFRPNDRIRAYIKEVRQEIRGPQIFLSRSAPEFMVELFRMEVPEIYNGTVEIRAVSRDPGSRAKICVLSHDVSIDPVGACVGMRGSRVQAVVSELQGEKIDIIPWNEDMPSLLADALQPAEVSKVVIDEDNNGRIEAIVPDDRLSLAIGRRGQNVRLASQLLGIDIDIITETQESERRQKEFEEHSEMFMQTMNVDEVVAQLLVSEGFATLEEVAYVEIEELSSIEGFDQETAEELQARALESLEEMNAKALAAAQELGVQQSLIDFDGLSPQMLVVLGEDGIKTLEDFATCADWELAGGYTTVDGKRQKDVGLLEAFNVNLAEAELMVMRARLQAGIISEEDFLIATTPQEEETEEGEETDLSGSEESQELQDGMEIVDSQEAGDSIPSEDALETAAPINSEDSLTDDPLAGESSDPVPLA